MTETATANLATTGGLPAGLRVTTLAGMIPVEFLEPGDRVVTRSGARTLRRVEVTVARDLPVVRVAPDTLGSGRPDAEIVLPADQPIVLSDWRAKVLYGTPRALVAAGRLADGEFIRADRVAELRIYRLVFDQPQVIYAEGLELVAAPAPALV
ncbi:MAG: Hint domain-containing protein [Gemmobacter sp.]